MQNISSILKRGLKFRISVRKKEVKKWSIFINQMQEHKLRGRGSHLKRFILHILHYEDHFRAVVQEQLKIESDEKIQVWRKQLTQAEKRIAELDRLFVKIYEDNAK